VWQRLEKIITAMYAVLQSLTNVKLDGQNLQLLDLGSSLVIAREVSKWDMLKLYVMGSLYV
jgi:hypothetical protein